MTSEEEIEDKITNIFRVPTLFEKEKDNDKIDVTNESLLEHAEVDPSQVDDNPMIYPGNSSAVKLSIEEQKEPFIPKESESNANMNRQISLAS